MWGRRENKDRIVEFKKQLDVMKRSFRVEADRVQELSEENERLRATIGFVKRRPDKPNDNRQSCNVCGLVQHRMDTNAKEPCRRCHAGVGHGEEFLDVMASKIADEKLLSLSSKVLTVCPSCHGVQHWDRKRCQRCKCVVVRYRSKSDIIRRRTDEWRHEKDERKRAEQELKAVMEAMHVAEELAHAVHKYTKGTFCDEIAVRLLDLRTPPAPKKVIRLSNLVKVEKQEEDEKLEEYRRCVRRVQELTDLLERETDLLERKTDPLERETEIYERRIRELKSELEEARRPVRPRNAIRHTTLLCPMCGGHVHMSDPSHGPKIAPFFCPKQTCAWEGEGV